MYKFTYNMEIFGLKDLLQCRIILNDSSEIYC